MREMVGGGEVREARREGGEGGKEGGGEGGQVSEEGRERVGGR